MATVASLTDSPSVGTFISVREIVPTSFSFLDVSFASSFDFLVVPSPIVVRSASMLTTVPSWAMISPIIPATGLGTSTVTLSVSSSQSISSIFMLSPGCLNHVATVASVTLSPRVGTRTSVIFCFPLNSKPLQRAVFVVLCAGLPVL